MTWVNESHFGFHKLLQTLIVLTTICTSATMICEPTREMRSRSVHPLGSEQREQ